jgi:hypothetical protein
MANLKAVHTIVYGAGKTAHPGEVVELSGANFPGGAPEVDRLLVSGAAELVSEPAAPEPEKAPAVARGGRRK